MGRLPGARRALPSGRGGVSPSPRPHPRRVSEGPTGLPERKGWSWHLMQLSRLVAVLIPVIVLRGRRVVRGVMRGPFPGVPLGGVLGPLQFLEVNLVALGVLGRGSSSGAGLGATSGGEGPGPGGGLTLVRERRVRWGVFLRGI